ncbi:nuclear transport factor 2 family protein [Sphingobium nicotianae]|uniref:SgcJ/EcaC family oxidoreductase n=1 Tax=Sphingobium nicotianae TaxID=2782607 RepID=A0A9X1DCE2_9SPHN|nr:nuclear transport factor 2 family protein [Sphingobium nicotianae]MBT2187371.1 SgcJ/EcaC family oxidoreductase [Sphingobium nicotianae]
MSRAALSVEQRLQLLEDKEDIRQIIIDYASALDAQDADAYIALFAEEAEWVNGGMVRKGKEEIRALVAGLFPTKPDDFVNLETFEVTFHPRIELNGDRAKMRSGHLLFRRGPGGNPVPVLFGRYEDEFIREDGVWKILRRVDIPTIPTGEEYLPVIRARQRIQEQHIKGAKG